MAPDEDWSSGSAAPACITSSVKDFVRKFNAARWGAVQCSKEAREEE